MFYPSKKFFVRNNRWAFFFQVEGNNILPKAGSGKKFIVSVSLTLVMTKTNFEEQNILLKSLDWTI